MSITLRALHDVRALNAGDIVRHKSSGDAYIVTDVDTERGTAFAVRTQTITHADEWLVIEREKRLE